MQLLHAFFFGVFLLILFYLGVKNGNATVGILNAGGTNFIKGVSTLQGR